MLPCLQETWTYYLDPSTMRASKCPSVFVNKVLVKLSDTYQSMKCMLSTLYKKYILSLYIMHQLNNYIKYPTKNNWVSKKKK